MAENSHISWTDHTFNGWIGCTKISPACDGCYAAHLMGGGRYSRVVWGEPGKGDGTRSRTAPSTWKLPRKWNKKAADAPGQTFVFCSSLADVFDNAVPAEWRADLFLLIRETPNLTWLLLTKRPGNILKLGPNPHLWPKNAAIGCTVVTQEEADRDVQKLLAAKAALKPAFAFLSMEPLLGPVDLTHLKRPHREGYGAGYLDALRGWTRGAGHGYREFDADAALDWVITGGETDQGVHKARPHKPDWFRSLRDQCAVAGVPYHHKQNGEWVSVSEAAGVGAFHKWEDGATVRKIGKNLDPCTLDGVKHDARPPVAA